MARTGVKRLVYNALQALHNASTAPETDRWFTRADIAKHLSAPSGTLNPARKGALEDLYSDGRIDKRTKPSDARGTWQYQLTNPPQPYD